MNNLKNNAPIKASRKNYNPTPFYFEDNQNDSPRYVVVIYDQEIISALIRTIIENMPQEIELVIKKYAVTPENVDTYDGYEWDFYYSEVSRDKVLKSLDEYKHFLFHDGSHQFIVKNPENDFYFNYDEHGVLFIYTGNSTTKIEHYLGKLKVLHQKAEMIWDKEHSHFSLLDSDALFKCLIEYLDLQKE